LSHYFEFFKPNYQGNYKKDEPNISVQTNSLLSINSFDFGGHAPCLQTYHPDNLECWRLRAAKFQIAVRTSAGFGKSLGDRILNAG
jgi:hypothetical protein